MLKINYKRTTAANESEELNIEVAPPPLADQIQWLVQILISLFGA